MSRRKNPRPLPEGSAPAYLVAIRCTDRRTHPRAAVATLGQFVGIDGTIRVLWQKAGRPDPLTGWQEPDGSRTFRFSCTRCAKWQNVELREANVLKFMELMRAAGQVRPVVDLSSLPRLLCLPAIARQAPVRHG
jgi:hypothetical protein